MLLGEDKKSITMSIQAEAIYLQLGESRATFTTGKKTNRQVYKSIARD